MAFSPGGKSLVTAEVKGHAFTEDSTIRLWDLGSGKAKWSVPSEQKVVLSVAFSPDGRWLATGGTSKGSVFLREATSGRPIRRHHELDGWMHGVAFSPDGRYLYAAGTNGRVLVWGTANGHARFPDDQHTAGLGALSQSPDGRTLATAGADSTIRFWDLGTGKTRVVLRGHEQGVLSVQFLPGGRQLVSAGGDGTVRVWDTATGRELRKLFNADKGWNARTVLSPDGKLLAVGEVQRVRLWNFAAGKEVRQIAGHEGYIIDLSFSADGAYLATAAHSYGEDGRKFEDDTVRVWQVATGEELFRHTILYPNCPLVTPDGRGVAFLGGPGGGSAQVFDFRSKRKRPGPGWEDVQTMAASSGGAWLATAHTDGSIRVRAAPSGQEVLRFQADAHRTYRLLWSADGKRLYSAHGDTTVLEWDLTPSAGSGVLTAEQAWADLASANGPAAYRAAWWFLTTTDPTAAIKPRLRAVPKGDKAERIRRLIAQLDDDTFAVREAAVKELTALGPAAEPALNRAAAGSASLEMRRRIRTIQERSAARELTADEWRNLRAVEVLERVGRAEARRVLSVLSEGDRDAQLTRAAAAALGRLGSSGHD
jgi:WD40 repeat protein